ncbi:MAG: PIG-L family deacetylase [Deltaproteobacteria bacterium]|nr:PIG-L family deacetylase [Deltaproteobacteria bacterium]
MNTKFNLMVVHAHPDDESIGTGGILTKYSAQGATTVLVYGTRGEAGEILNPDFVPPSPGMQIKDIRAQELRKAVKALGVKSVYYLGYRDSGMSGSPENHHPKAFAQADMKEATRKLVNIIRRVHPHVIVTYNERGFYGHPDHIMANKVTRQAFHSAGDPEFVGRKGLNPWQPTKLYYIAVPIERLRMMYRLALEDVREYVPQKWQALNCHQSQIGPNSFFARLPKEWRDEAFGYEYFVCGTSAKGMER